MGNAGDTNTYYTHSDERCYHVPGIFIVKNSDENILSIKLQF